MSASHLAPRRRQRERQSASIPAGPPQAPCRAPRLRVRQDGPRAPTQPGTTQGLPPGDPHAEPATALRRELRLPAAGGAKARLTHPRPRRGEHRREKRDAMRRGLRGRPAAQRRLPRAGSAPGPPRQSARPCPGGGAAALLASPAAPPRARPNPAGGWKK